MQPPHLDSVSLCYTPIGGSTDAYDTAHGWMLIYQPNYPELSLDIGTPMAQGASGVRLVPVYHANPTLAPLTDLPSDEGTFANGEIGEACDTCTCVGCAVEGRVWCTGRAGWTIM